MPAEVDPLSGVRAGYDRWASVYDQDDNPLQALEEPHVRDALGDVRHLDVLDLGCGTGRHTSWLAAAGARVTAVDFSHEMLERARRKVAGTEVQIILHDLHEPLPLEDTSFDAVVSGLVLEHIRDPRAFFMEAHRVMRPGGRAVVSAMHPAMFLRDAWARFTDPDSGDVVAPGSLPHQLGDFVMAALECRLHIAWCRRICPGRGIRPAPPAGRALPRVAHAGGARIEGAPGRGACLFVHPPICCIERMIPYRLASSASGSGRYPAEGAEPCERLPGIGIPPTARASLLPAPVVSGEGAGWTPRSDPPHR